MPYLTKLRLAFTYLTGVGILLTGLAQQPLVWAQGDTPQAYFQQVVHLIKTQALHRDYPNWQQLEQRTQKRIKQAQRIRDVYPAIHYLLEQLQDGHSFFIEAHPSLSPDTGVMQAIRGQLIKQIAYLQLPAIQTTGPLAQAYAHKVQQLILRFHQQGAKAWIIDLRHNTGGNMWPMLLAIAPLLGQSKLGYFISPNGPSEAWFYRANQVGYAKQLMLALPPIALPKALRQQPVALLIGPDTSSAAEAILVAFSTRPHTRLFGQSTRGLTSCNACYSLQDGSQLFLTVAHLANANGRLIQGQIVPQVSTSHALPAALAWLTD